MPLSDKTTASDPAAANADTKDQSQRDRNPIEAIASDVLQSIRGGHRPSIDPIVQANPNHESELRDLLPVIERLERARKAQSERPNGLASLGTQRPDQLGDFELVRQIGRGGMGVVFEARQRSLGRKVAVKVLPKSLLVDDVQLKRFQQEARTAASLHHTNIVPVFGVGEDQGFHYYVMQCIDGRGLDQVMAESSGRLPSEQVAHMGQQAASALAHAHSQKVLHRDIKPANLIVNDENQLWVTDFGVAKAIESEAMTRTGDVVGTLRYMAPEQIVGSTDVRSDLYSLGVTLYELLAGRPAIDDGSIRSAIVSRQPVPDPPRLRQLNPNVPRDLETILHNAMAMNPARRYATAQAMADDLQRFLDGDTISVRRASALQKSARWAKRNPAVATLAVLSTLLLISIALVSTLGNFRLQSVVDKEQIARRNAETTAALAADALDHVFQEFSATPSGKNNELTEFTPTPTISDETAELLEGLLPYFDDLASRGHSAPNLKQSAIDARYAIGDIHFQLGRYERSIEQFQIALRTNVSNDADSVIRNAQIHNRIGFANRMLGHSDQAKGQHETALGLLQGLTLSSDQADSKRESLRQFELARTHFLLGSRVAPGMQPTSLPPKYALTTSMRPHAPRRSRVRGNPNFGIRPTSKKREHLNAAIKILRNHLQSEPESLQHNVALASCLRQLIGDSLATRTSDETEYEQEALQILRDVHNQHPQNASVLAELANTLTAFTVFEELTHDDLWLATERCREAAKHCDVLVASHPNVQSHVNTRAHTLFRLGVLLERLSTESQSGHELTQDACEAFQRAARQQSMVVRKHPEKIGYRAWMGLFLMRYADVSVRAGNFEQAEQSLTQASNTWLKLREDFPNESISWEVVPMVFGELSKVQHRLGKHEEAQKSLNESEIQHLMNRLGETEAAD